MQRVTMSWVVQQIENINFLDRLAFDTPTDELIARLRIGRAAIQELLANSIYRPYIKVSVDKAEALFGSITEMLQDAQVDANFKRDAIDFDVLDNQFRAFKTVILAELATFPTYLVTHKGVYDVERLIDLGALQFPLSLTTKVPEAIVDAEEAGRCLAFERNTACGFHVFRVVEFVLRRYWDLITNNKPRPEPATLGRMAGDLENWA